MSAVPLTPGVRAASVGGSAPPKSSLLKAGLIVAVIVIAGLFVPSFVKSTFYLGLMINAIVLAIAAVAIGFLGLQCGLMMFGAAAFTGGATYLFGIAIMSFGWTVMGAALFCLVASTVLSGLIGAVIMRARPLPFAMLTLALAQMLQSMVKITDFRPVTGGDDGLTMSWNSTFFGLSQAQLAKPDVFWPVAWLLLCGVMLVAWTIGHMRIGQVLRATTANEERMRFSGFDTYWPRVLAFTVSGFIAAVSGLITGLNSAFASPELLDFVTGGNGLVATLVGGMGTVTGPVLGAILYTIGQDQFGASGHLELFTGLGVVIVIVAFPQGAMGFIQNMYHRLRRLFTQGGGNAAR
ncbi:MAG: branched-chain amino acid ABC transporter permease [Burkholderiales bacterium]